MEIVQNSGAYPEVGAILPTLTKMCASGPYAIPRIEADAVSVVTNTTPVTAYRGAGRPEAAAAIERRVDISPAEAGWTRPTSGAGTSPGRRLPVHDGQRRQLRQRRLRPRARPPARGSGYRALRAEQERRRAAGDPRQLGIGLCVYIEITNGFAEPE